MARSFRVRTSSAKARPSEDRADVIERGNDLVIVVADGAGGMRGAADASQTVVDAVRSMRPNADLRSMLTDVDRALAQAAIGETTAIVAIVSEDGSILGASVGDSEAWIVGATTIDELTGSQDRRRLGSGRAEPTLFSRTALEGTLIVATDGLFKYAPRTAIAAVVRTCSHPADALIESTNTPDDITIVTVR